MAKLHFINDKNFKMDNGELECQFGMSIVCRVKTGWGQPGDVIEFYYKDQKLTGPETHVGDFVFMEHDGPRTTWLIAKKPRDPRLQLLWAFGYRSATRITVEEPTADVVVHELRVRAGFEYDDPDPSDWAWREPLPSGSKKPTIIVDKKGNTLVALYAGYVTNGSGRTYCYWFMADDATLDDVKSALRASSSCNREHPLLQ